MASRHERPNTVLPVTVAIFVGVTNLLLLIFAKQYSFAVEVYAYLSIPMCAYGLLGIITENPRCIAVFANYLFLDAAAWALGRLLVALFLFVIILDDDVCSGYNPKWSSENFQHDIVTSVQRFRDEQIGRSSHKKRCQVQVGAFQTIVLLLFMAFTAAQASMAIGMRRHGKTVDNYQRAGLVPESEKAVLVIVSDANVGECKCDLV